MSAMVGMPVVWGVPPKMLPFLTELPGRVRLRFRNNDFGRAFIKTKTGIRHFIIFTKDDGESQSWYLAVEQGRNERRAA